MVLPTNRVTGGPVQAADINAIAAQSNANEAALAGKAATSHTHTAEQITGLPAVTDASTTTKGIVELATNAEATTGTDTTRAVTPSGVKAVVDSLSIPPTPGNASTTVPGLVELATNTEALDGTDATRAVTPAGVRAVVEALPEPGAGTWDALDGKPAYIAAGDSQSEARAAIGAGTSNLAVGTGATDAKAGNYTPPVTDIPNLPASKVTTGTFATQRIPALPYRADSWTPGLADLPAGTTLTIVRNGANWTYGGTTITSRPTSRPDVHCIFYGGTEFPVWAINGDVLFPEQQ